MNAHTLRDFLLKPSLLLSYSSYLVLKISVSKRKEKNDKLCPIFIKSVRRIQSSACMRYLISLNKNVCHWILFGRFSCCIQVGRRKNVGKVKLITVLPSSSSLLIVYLWHDLCFEDKAIGNSITLHHPPCSSYKYFFKSLSRVDLGLQLKIWSPNEFMTCLNILWCNQTQPTPE